VSVRADPEDDGTRPRPAGLGGAGFAGDFSMSSYAQTKPIPPVRVVVVVVGARITNIEP
jgi:hypothetical protein